MHNHQFCLFRANHEEWAYRGQSLQLEGPYVYCHITGFKVLGGHKLLECGLRGLVEHLFPQEHQQVGE